MDFSIPAPTLALLDRVRAFMDEHVYPVEAELLALGFPAVEPRLAGLGGAGPAAGLRRRPRVRARPPSPRPGGPARARLPRGRAAARGAARASPGRQPVAAADAGRA